MVEDAQAADDGEEPTPAVERVGVLVRDPLDRRRRFLPIVRRLGVLDHTPGSGPPSKKRIGDV